MKPSAERKWLVVTLFGKTSYVVYPIPYYPSDLPITCLLSCFINRYTVIVPSLSHKKAINPDTKNNNEIIDSSICCLCMATTNLEGVFSGF